MIPQTPSLFSQTTGCPPTFSVMHVWRQNGPVVNKQVENDWFPTLSFILKKCLNVEGLHVILWVLHKVDAGERGEREEQMLSCNIKDCVFKPCGTAVQHEAWNFKHHSGQEMNSFSAADLILLNSKIILRKREGSLYSSQTDKHLKTFDILTIN